MELRSSTAPAAVLLAGEERAEVRRDRDAWAPRGRCQPNRSLAHTQEPALHFIVRFLTADGGLVGSGGLSTVVLNHKCGRSAASVPAPRCRPAARGFTSQAVRPRQKVQPRLLPAAAAAVKRVPPPAAAAPTAAAAAAGRAAAAAGRALLLLALVCF